MSESIFKGRLRPTLSTHYTKNNEDYIFIDSNTYFTIYTRKKCSFKLVYNLSITTNNDIYSFPDRNENYKGIFNYCNKNIILITSKILDSDFVIDKKVNGQFIENENFERINNLIHRYFYINLWINNEKTDLLLKIYKDHCEIYGYEEEPNDYIIWNCINEGNWEVLAEKIIEQLEKYFKQEELKKE